MAFTNSTSREEESSFAAYSSPKQRQWEKKERFIPGQTLQPRIYLAQGLSQVQWFDKYTRNCGPVPLLDFHSQGSYKFG